eukprot:CAMPEP_0116913816 /NCGR_PEP_ID=MMETSP0467-20121206/16933_1 /TAXON_ID=283647 /ORGANISM="Mesodinium pulex, Strain SPMC105" /LENGTH=94 /DNA_ID=CAMNT_0004590111 /DNA_START=955 /DNA_END=1239 /DNA_ORIENTATION=+
MTQWVEPARKFYLEQSARLNTVNFAFDIICASVDQFGLYEMKAMSERTGGSLVFNDTYMSDVFKKSLVKIFTKMEPAEEEDSEPELTPSFENSS